MLDAAAGVSLTKRRMSLDEEDTPSVSSLAVDLDTSVSLSLSMASAAAERVPLQVNTDAGSARQTYFLLLAILPEAIIETMLAPLLPFMVKSMSGNASDVGYLTGLISGSFYFPLLVTNMMWGSLSDRPFPGPRFILLISVAVCGLTTSILGITTVFWIAVLCRLMAGVFGGASTVVKGTIGDLHRDEAARAWGFSVYGSMYAIAGIFGPVIGGFLTHPVKTKELQERSFLDTYPFFLPCMFGAALAAFSFAISLKSLNLRPRRHGRPDDPVDTLTPSLWKVLQPLIKAMKPKVMFPVGLYTFAFRTLVANLRVRGSYQVGMAMLIPACIGMNLVGQYMRGDESSESAWLFTIIIMILFGFVEAIAYLSVIIMITDSVDPGSLGAAHGLAATCAAGARTLAPPLAGTFWQLGVLWGIPWLIFAVIAFAGIFGIFLVNISPKQERGAVGYTTLSDDDTELEGFEDE
ncbi:hypothetical protein HDU67_008806 [Dinochytrium kinnereticum]|nr:hypothetical protein HDU67_008806 [Dinochytrium kinnereticum]